MLAKLPNFVKYGGFILTGLVVFGYSGGAIYPAPEHVKVLVDPITRLYYAPPCAAYHNEDLRRRLELSTLRQVDQFGYKPHQGCVNEGAYIQEGRSLTGQLLQTIGLLPPIRSRWNADGSWNW